MNLPSNSKIHAQRCASRGCFILAVRNVVPSYILRSKFNLEIRNFSGEKGVAAVVQKITRIATKMAQRIAALKILATTRGLLRNTCHPRHTSVATQISRTFSTAPELAEETHSSTFQYATIGDIMRKKGASDDGSWLWCTQADTVYDAVKSVRLHMTFLENLDTHMILRSGKNMSSPLISLYSHCSELCTFPQDLCFESSCRYLAKIQPQVLFDLQMTSHNVGALLVLKSDGSGAIAGIITERGQPARFVHIFLKFLNTTRRIGAAPCHS